MPAWAGWGRRVEAAGEQGDQAREEAGKRETGPIDVAHRAQGDAREPREVQDALQTEMAERERVTKFLATVKSPRPTTSARPMDAEPDGQKLGNAISMG
jgi:hypothetical protein